MFVYENKNHEICIVFDSIVPAETPAYVLKIDKAEKKLYVNGTAIEPQAAAEAASEPVEEVTPEEVPAAGEDELEENEEEV